MAKTKNRPTLRVHKETLMVRARKHAQSGDCMGFEDVRRKFDDSDALTLKLWATARDRDEIDQICDKARVRFRTR